MNYVKANLILKIPIILLVLIIIIVCVSCDKISFEILEFSIVDVDYDVSTPFALVDDSVVYLVLNAQSATFYRYYLNKNEVVEIGTINNHLLTGKSNTIIENILYFYVSEDFEGEMVNTLYGIDLSSNTLFSLTKDNNSQHLTTLSSFNKNILSLKGNFIDENSYISYFDIFDISTGTETLKCENSINVSSQEGSVILNYCYYKEKLYTLYEEIVNNKSITKIRVYNNEFIIEQTLELSELDDYIFESGISEIRVIDDYIFITNTSNYSVIGKIMEDSIKPILMERNLEIANFTSNSTLQEKVFYIRKTNQIYLLDIEQGELDKYSLDEITDETIRCVLSDENNILIVLKTLDNIEKVIYLNRDDINQINN